MNSVMTISEVDKCWAIRLFRLCRLEIFSATDEECEIDHQGTGRTQDETKNLRCTTTHSMLNLLNSAGI